MNKLIRYILLIQAIYILITAIWPLVDIESFVRISGLQVDTAIVKTVCGLLFAVAVILLFSLAKKIVSPLIIVTALICSVAFLSLDLLFLFTGTISSVYLLDAFVQLSFLLAWTISLVRFRAAE